MSTEERCGTCRYFVPVSDTGDKGYCGYFNEDRVKAIREKESQDSLPPDVETFYETCWRSK